MSRLQDPLFDPQVWKSALEKYGAVTHLTVILYDAEKRIVGGPAPPTAIFGVFEKHGYDPGIFADCASQCLAQATNRPALIVAPSYGLAVVGASLVLEGRIVGAAVAGYALVDFSQDASIERLARQAGMPFRDLWTIARREQPVPERRLLVHGELLQVLGDTILRENYRTRQYEETAARLEKEMAAKDEFLAVVSHELRTPLTPILGWASLIETRDKPEERRKAADAIRRSALTEMKLVDDLLDVSRIMKGKMSLETSALDLVALLGSAVETIAGTAAGKSIQVEYVRVNMALTVSGDSNRLQQVFVNILANAVKFTPAGGRVRVVFGQDANEAVVRIEDTGHGIAREFLPHVYDMFRQQEIGTRRQYAGLGIGLALVKRIVELHQGHVETTSEGEGRGTQVTVRLPLASLRPATHLSNSNRIADAVPFDRLCILAVEDVEDTLGALSAVLESLGASVVLARDGVEALQALNANNPDVVLCDLRMPRMDGFEFLRELQRTHGRNGPPVIALTAFASEADHQRTQAAGFEGHVDKPFDNEKLVSTVQSVMAQRVARPR